MINDKREDQRAADVKRRDPCCPLQRVGLPVGRTERHDTRDIKRARAHESKRLCLADDIRHCLAEHGVIRCHSKGRAEGRVKHCAVPDKGRVQHSEDRFFGKCRTDEAHKCPPPEAEHSGHRLNRSPDLVEKAVRHISASAVGEDPEKQGNQCDRPKCPFENIPRLHQSLFENMLPVGLVIRRKLHDHAAAGIFRNQLTSEHFRYNRHQDHGIEQNAADDQHCLPGCEKHGTDHGNNRPDRRARHRPDDGHRQHALAPVVHDAGSARASDRAAKAHQDRANGLPLQPKPRKQTVELLGCPGKEPDLLQISEDEIDAKDKAGHCHTEVQRAGQDDAED